MAQEFQIFKDLMLYYLQSKLPEDAKDTRLSHPYIALTFTNKTNPNFRIRRNLFNLDNKELMPHLPPTFLTLQME